MARFIEGNLKADGKKFAIVVSRFNSFLSEKLLEGALDSLQRSGAASMSSAFPVLSRSH
jgi:6,7-dimethyl-8-ribityllumazine synthase